MRTLEWWSLKAEAEEWEESRWAEEAMMACTARDEDEDEECMGGAPPSSGGGRYIVSSLKVADLPIPCLLLRAILWEGSKIYQIVSEVATTGEASQNLVYVPGGNAGCECPDLSSRRNKLSSF